MLVKRHFILLLLGVLLGSVSLTAQEKLFKSALEKGPDPDGFYTIYNTKTKYSLDDFRSVARRNNYLLHPQYRSKEVNRFGDVTTFVEVIRFVPETEHLATLFYALTDGLRKGESFRELRHGGSAMLYFYPTPKKEKDYFWRYNNIYWSGAIENNWISGTGVGIAMSDKWIVGFSGNFYKGYPQGKTHFRWIELKDIKVNYDASKVYRVSANMGTFRDDMTWFEIDGRYGFVNALTHTKIAPQFRSVVSNFQEQSSGSNYAVVVNPRDGKEWKMSRTGELFAYSDAEQKKIDEAKAEEARLRIEAQKKAEEERRIAEEKAAEQRRIAEEKRLAYLKKVQANSDKNKWQRGDRLCLEFGREGQYITGTLEEWNKDKSKCKIKIVTSPGSRIRYNGDNLEKNNLIWISTSGEGWHKALPEEIEAANRDDSSTHYERHTIQTLVKCHECGGDGNTSSYSYRKCSRCDGTGLIMKEQTF